MYFEKKSICTLLYFVVFINNYLYKFECVK